MCLGVDDSQILSKTWFAVSQGLILAAAVQVKATENTPFKWTNLESMRKSVVQ